MKEDWTEEQVRKYVGDGNDTHVIPVNVAAAAGQRVLNFRTVEEILARSERIAVADCFCRRKMQRCEHTLEGCVFLGTWHALLTSTYGAAHDGDLCAAGGAGVERGHFGAGGRGGEGIVFDPGACFGCGLCVGTCPTGAQTLVEK